MTANRISSSVYAFGAAKVARFSALANLAYRGGLHNRNLIGIAKMTMKINRLIRTFGPAVAAGAVLVIAACGTASAPSTRSAGTARGSVDPRSASPSVTQPTGAQLQSMLVTDVPAGFALDTKGTANSGEALQVPSTGAVASKSQCGQLSATSFISTTGVSGISFAQSDYADKANNEISQEIDTFNKGDGAVVMTRM